MSYEVRIEEVTVITLANTSTLHDMIKYFAEKANPGRIPGGTVMWYDWEKQEYILQYHFDSAAWTGRGD